MYYTKSSKFIPLNLLFYFKMCSTVIKIIQKKLNFLYAKTIVSFFLILGIQMQV